MQAIGFPNGERWKDYTTCTDHPPTTVNGTTLPDVPVVVRGIKATLQINRAKKYLMHRGEDGEHARFIPPRNHTSDAAWTPPCPA